MFHGALDHAVSGVFEAALRYGLPDRPGLCPPEIAQVYFQYAGCALVLEHFWPLLRGGLRVFPVSNSPYTALARNVFDKIALEWPSRCVLRANTASVAPARHGRCEKCPRRSCWSNRVYTTILYWPGVLRAAGGLREGV